MMANVIRAVFAFFWLAASVFLGYLAYIVVMTESNPRILSAWLVMCAVTFASATFLAYTIIAGYRHRANAPHHHTYLHKS